MYRNFVPRVSRRGLLIAVICLLIIPVSYFVATDITIGRVAHAQVQATPFLLVMNMYSFEKSPVGELFRTQTTARRSDGTTSLSGSVGLISWNQNLKKITFMDGRSVTIADLLSSRTTLKKLNLEVAQLKQLLTDPPQNCKQSSVQVVLREDSLMGVRVSVLQTEAGNHRLTSWNAPALGCEAVQYRTDTKQSDGTWKLAAEARPVSLTIGEPDASLFDPRSDYTEMKPSEVQRKFFEKVGAPPDDGKSQRKMLDRLDLKYATHQ